MNRRGATTVLLLGALASARAFSDESVVLVSNKALSAENLSSLTVRKAFLGLPTTHGDITLRGVRNASDPRLTGIFLQVVVAMSGRSYDHRLLSQALQSGTPPPVEVESNDDLVRMLSNDPGALSYMWYEDAIRYPNIQIVRVLWRSD